MPSTWLVTIFRTHDCLLDTTLPTAPITVYTAHDCHPWLFTGIKAVYRTHNYQHGPLAVFRIHDCLQDPWLFTIQDLWVSIEDPCLSTRSMTDPHDSWLSTAPYRTQDKKGSMTHHKIHECLQDSWQLMESMIVHRKLQCPWLSGGSMTACRISDRLQYLWLSISVTVDFHIKPAVFPSSVLHLVSSLNRHQELNFVSQRSRVSYLIH
jgi:hypothetical protein